jgi:uncharacterized SAM-binding protein YcdF (DUF218 family)
VLRRLLLGLAVLVTTWLAACLVLFVWPPSESSPPAHADAIVVLSGDKRRLTHALELVRSGIAPVLALSSVDRTPNWRTAQELCAAGRYRTARVVCFHATPYSTQGEAREVRRLARERSWRSIVVVTSTFHVTRAALLFGRCLDVPVRTIGTSSPWWRLPEEWASETGKLVVQVTIQRSC